MNKEQAESKKFLKEDNSSKRTLLTGLFFVFLSMTIVAALFRLFGMSTFESTFKINEPSQMIQKIIKSALFVIEDIFVYKILTRRNWMVCLSFSCIHLIVSGFFASNISWVVDIAILLLLSVLSRRKWSTIVDFLFLYALMTLYGFLSVFAKTGSVSVGNRTSFYVGIITGIDYKLFIVTLYLYTLMKGGIRLWKRMRFSLLDPRA